MLIVFDNIDKSNTTIFDIILQIFESGLYLDSLGRWIVLGEVLVIYIYIYWLGEVLVISISIYPTGYLIKF